VVIPLLTDTLEHPAKGVADKLMARWIYTTLNRGGNSVWETLSKDPNIRDPNEYFSVYSLRNHARINGVPVTEEIYVHAKVMIVDDDIVIMGSANVNDRSMLGSRDSEIAIVMEDSVKVKSRMAGKEVSVSNLVHSLRKQLFREHLHMTEEDVMDPLDPKFLKMMDHIAVRNTEIYREIFRVVPDDNVTKFDQQKEFEKGRDLGKYDKLAIKIQGHLVKFPMKYALEEDFLEKNSGDGIPSYLEVIFT